MRNKHEPCRKPRFSGQRSAYLFCMKCYFFLDVIICYAIFRPWQRNNARLCGRKYHVGNCRDRFGRRLFGRDVLGSLRFGGGLRMHAINQKFHPDSKSALCHAMAHFIAKGPRLEFGNYGDVSAYRAEQRAITRDLKDARTFLRLVEMSSITFEDLKVAMRDAWGGRLSWDGATLDYCAGQYWPTEYRKAVAAMCALALKRHWWQGAPDGFKNDQMKKQFGRGMASRWFK